LVDAINDYAAQTRSSSKIGGEAARAIISVRKSICTAALDDSRAARHPFKIAVLYDDK